MATWRQLLKEELDFTGDKLINLTITLTSEELDLEFDNGYGGVEGKPFTAWSKNYVYFPVCYDGKEWVESVPRNPCETKTEHVGGY